MREGKDKELSWETNKCFMRERLKKKQKLKN